MSIQLKTGRLLTTHVGSLPRPRALLDLMKAKFEGTAVDSNRYEESLRSAVTEYVRKQAEAGIDIFTDGEQSSPVFFLRARATGRIRGGPDQRSEKFAAEVAIKYEIRPGAMPPRAKPGTALLTVSSPRGL
jgi:5-methyltetrahydropteroyltriglutamate--homocysteine methyltransferase